MTFYMKRGSVYMPTHEANIQVTKILPPETFTVKLGDDGFYLDITAHLDFDGKVYGDSMRRVDRAISTFHDRPNNTGILLQGEKGSGKTLLVKLISKKLREQKIPTILISNAWRGEQFNSFIASIEQPALVVFDEFEKLYKPEEQEILLTLFDGVVTSKKLFAVTINDSYRIVSHLKNRPGRFFYLYNYTGLEKEAIIEYCKENLHNKEEINKIVTYSSMFNNFSFDGLKAVVEEMNRYKEPFHQAVKDLNLSPLDMQAKFKVLSLQHDANFPIEEVEKLASDGAYVNPTKSGFYVTVYGKKVKESPKKEKDIVDIILSNHDDDDEEDTKDGRKVTWVSFTAHDLKSVKDGQFSFENEKGSKCVIEKENFKPEFSVERLVMSL